MAANPATENRVEQHQTGASLKGRSATEAKAEVWDEGFKAAREAYGLNHAAPLDLRISNPYRTTWKD